MPIIAVPVLVPLMAPRVRATQGTRARKNKSSPTFHEFSSTFSLSIGIPIYYGTNSQEFVVAIPFQHSDCKAITSPNPTVARTPKRGGVVVWADGCLVSDAQIQANHIPDQPFSLDMVEGSLEVKLPTIWTDEKQSREEAERRERVRRKKMQMREKVGKSRNTVFSQ